MDISKMSALLQVLQPSAEWLPEWPKNIMDVHLQHMVWVVVLVFGCGCGCWLVLNDDSCDRWL